MDLIKFKTFAAFSEEFYDQKYGNRGSIFVKGSDADKDGYSWTNEMTCSDIFQTFGKEYFEVSRIKVPYNFTHCDLFKDTGVNNMYIFDVQKCEAINNTFIGLFHPRTIRAHVELYGANKITDSLLFTFNIFNISCAFRFNPDADMPFSSQFRDNTGTGCLYYSFVTLLNKLFHYDKATLQRMLFSIMSEEDRVDIAESMLKNENLKWRDYISL